jgi:hypothetical protein
VREAVRPLELILDAVGRKLHDLVADVPAERVVDDTEALDIERHDQHLRAFARTSRQQSCNSLAEQGPLGETGQWIEVGEKPDGIFLVQILKRERQVRGDLAQHA